MSDELDLAFLRENLEYLVGNDPEEAVDIALALAQDVNGLSAQVDTLIERQSVEPVFYCQTHLCGSCGGCKAAEIKDENSQMREQLAKVREVRDEMWNLIDHSAYIRKDFVAVYEHLDAALLSEVDHG